MSQVNPVNIHLNIMPFPVAPMRGTSSPSSSTLTWSSQLKTKNSEVDSVIFSSPNYAILCPKVKLITVFSDTLNICSSLRV